MSKLKNHYLGLVSDPISKNWNREDWRPGNKPVPVTPPVEISPRRFKKILEDLFEFCPAGQDRKENP